MGQIVWWIAGHGGVNPDAAFGMIMPFPGDTGGDDWRGTYRRVWGGARRRAFK